MPSQCAVLAAMQDLDDIYEHMNEFCIECIEAQLEDAANGQEHIFTDGPPSWIAEQQAKEAAERAERERQEAMNKKRAAFEKKKEPRLSWASAEEEKKEAIRKMAKEFSDKHLEFEIRKLMKVDDATASQMRMELKREFARERKEKEKAEEKEEMKQQIKQQKEAQRNNPDAAPKEKNKIQKPWQPQLLRIVAAGDARRSALSVEEQKRYVAILTNFHRIDQSMRFSQNNKDLKMYDDRLSDERVAMEEIVRAYLKDATVSLKELQPEIEHVMQRWSSRYQQDQRRFERMRQLPWKRASETPPVSGVLKPVLERVLMAAPSPKLVFPTNMHDRLPVNYVPYRFDPRGKQRNDIEKDTALSSLLADTGCAIAMECTTAVHLMGRPGEPRNYAYNIPVTVTELFRGGGASRLLFLGKPRPQSGVTNHTLLHMVAKYRAKSTYTTKPEDPHSKAGQSRDTVATKTDTVQDKMDEGGEEKGEGGEKKEGGGGSLLDDLLGNLITPASSSSSTTTAGGGTSTAKTSTTAHSYGLFTIPSYTQPETKVIIRSSPSVRYDATGGTEYTLTAKVEMAAEAGCSRESFEEMLWTSMKTLFKGAVNSATIHMHPWMKDALQITHARAVPPGTHLNEPFFPLLCTRTEALSRLLAELQTLESGEYLIQVSPLSEELTLFRENPRGNELFFNKGPKRILGPLKCAENFLGIDDKRVLHWQVMQGRAPLTLWPEGHHILKTHQGRERKEAELAARKGHKRKAEMGEQEKKLANFNSHKRRKSRAWNKRKTGPIDLDKPE